MNKFRYGLIPATLILMIFAAAGCGSPSATYSDSSQAISTGVNREFSIALESNPTTGYSWQADYDTAYLNLESDEYHEGEKPDANLVGSGGTQYLKFKALKAGGTRITCTYRRPWEQPSTEDKQVVFEIKIK